MITEHGPAAPPEPKSGRSTNLFVYGELCRASVLRQQLGRVPPTAPALLEGFRRRLNLSTGYYEAHPAQRARIAGWVLQGLDEQDLARLDRYEGIDYRRATVQLKRITDEAIIEAEVYLSRVRAAEKEVGSKAR